MKLRLYDTNHKSYYSDYPPKNNPQTAGQSAHPLRAGADARAMAAGKNDTTCAGQSVPERGKVHEWGDESVVEEGGDYVENPDE